VMRIIIILSFLFSPAAANAADSFDLSTGQLSIPRVIAGDTKYFDLIVTINSLVSGGELTSPLATSNLGPRPDTYDLKKGQLIIPAVTVDNTVYKNLIVTIGEVVYFGGKTEKASKSGYNGEIFPEPYKLTLSADLPDSVEVGVRKALDAAAQVWGNFGPLEYYVVGSDLSAVRDLENQFCNEPDGRFGSQQNCQNWAQSDGAFENNVAETIRMLKGETPFYSAGLRGGLPINLIISSLPPHLSGINFDARFGVEATGGKVILHEYWHNIQHSHIPHDIQGLDREAYLGPQWFTEGTAEYMAILAQSDIKAAESLVDPDHPKYSGLQAMKSFMEEAQNGGVTSESFSVKNILPSSQLKYAVGAWATAFLLNKVEDDTALLDIFLPYVAELGWEEAFVKTFGITSDTFYAEFDAFLLLPYDEQVKILPSSLI
jgi:hypothetical protein